MGGTREHELTDLIRLMDALFVSIRLHVSVYFA